MPPTIAYRLGQASHASVPLTMSPPATWSERSASSPLQAGHTRMSRSFGFTACRSLNSPPLSPPGEEPHEAHEESQMHRQEVVGHERVADPPHGLTEHISESAPSVEEQLGHEEATVDRRVEQQGAGDQHPDEQEGQHPPEQLVREEREPGHRVHRN